MMRPIRFDGNPATFAVGGISGFSRRSVGQGFCIPGTTCVYLDRVGGVSVGAIPSAAAIPSMSLAQLQAALNELNATIVSEGTKVLGFKATKLAFIQNQVAEFNRQRDALLKRGLPPTDRNVRTVEEQLRDLLASKLGEDLVDQLEQRLASYRSTRDKVLIELGRRGA